MGSKQRPLLQLVRHIVDVANALSTADFVEQDSEGLVVGQGLDVPK